MKRVPELRFPEFKDEWESDKLKNHAKIYDGTHQTPSYKESGIRFVSVENISNLLSSNKYISKKDYDKEYKNKLAEKNDVLMTRIGDIGTPAIIDFDEEIAYYVTLSLIKCNSKLLNSRFLHYCIQSDGFQKELYKRTLHIAFPKKINLGEIGQCSLFLPSKQEQGKIADFFSTLDSRIEIQDKKINNLEDQKKGYMQRIFSQEIRFKDENGEDYPEWEEKRLGEIAKCHDSKRIPISATKREQIVGQYPYYGANGIQGYINDYIFEGEFVLLAEDGGNFDDFATRPIAQFVSGKFWVNNHAHILSTMNNTKFMYYSLVHKDIRAYVNGTSRSKLNQSDMLQIKILQPSLKEQQKIADFLSLFDEKIEIERKILETLQEMKRGFLQKMFV